MTWIEQVLAGLSDLQGMTTNFVVGLLGPAVYGAIWLWRWSRRRFAELQDGTPAEQDAAAYYWLTHLHPDVDLPIRTFANAVLVRQAMQSMAVGGILLAIALFTPKLVGGFLAGTAVVAFCEARRRAKVPAVAACTGEVRLERIAELRLRLGYADPKVTLEEVERMRRRLVKSGYVVEIRPQGAEPTVRADSDPV